MISIVDFGIGNVRAFLAAYKRLDIRADTASSPREVERAERLILPGVGAFDWAMHRLAQSGLREPLEAAVLGRRVPVLGVCVGMQMLAQSSEEGGRTGLGWIRGQVKRLHAARRTPPVQLPHMGWNIVEPGVEHPLLRGLGPDTRYYFLHSYHLVPADRASVIAECDYHGRFACAVAAGNVMGVQFHPEKSHDAGAALLKRFAEL